MIDWFTVIAQIVNFLILVGLLKYFLYGRIMAAMEKREQQIADRWNEADRIKQSATQEAEAVRQKNHQLDMDREQHLTKMRAEVESQRRQLTKELRSDIDETQVRWTEAIRQETESFLRDLRKRASEEVWIIARRVLADLANEGIERHIVMLLLDRIERMDGDERQVIIAAIQEARGSVLVRSAFNLADELRQQFTEALKESLASDVNVRFETSPDLVCGIEIHTNSHKLAWEMKDYLDALEDQMERAIEEETADTTKRNTDDPSPELATVQ